MLDRARDGAPVLSTGAPRVLRVADLGLIGYAECWELQRELAAALGRGEGKDTLLLLEHPHTYTCGRRGGRENILIGEEQLASEGVAVLDVDRGGDVTYHGPGQLVAYPIINLLARSERIDYPRYVRALERVLIDSLADFGISARQIEGFSGAWVGPDTWSEKIAAIGVKVDGRGITSHGIALNVAPDLRFFSYIVPCGISDKGVTSMQVLLGEAPPMDQVKTSFARHFASVFDFGPIEDADLARPLALPD
jgi:lipoyl(octanoyl) transferase